MIFGDASVRQEILSLSQIVKKKWLLAVQEVISAIFNSCGSALVSIIDNQFSARFTAVCFDVRSFRRL